MKQLYKTLILFFIFSSYAFAQDTTKTKPYKWGIGVQVNTVEKLPPLNAFSDQSFIGGDGNKENRSFSFGVLTSYSLRPDLSIRYRYAHTKMDFKNTFIQILSDKNVTNNYYLKETINHFAIGIQWNNSLSKKIFFYGGFEISYNNYSKYDLSYVTSGFDATVNNGMPFTSISKQSLLGGFSLGVSPYMGFIVNLTENILFGAEYSIAYDYSKIAVGDFTYEDTTKDNASGNIIYYDKGVFIGNSYKGLGIANQRASVNITYLIY